MRVLSAPLELSWIITNKCNLKCRHCLNSDLRNAPELTSEEAIAVIKQIIELRIFKVLISGGEPLARKDLFTIIDTLAKAKINLTLFTNGTLITKDIAKRLAASRIGSYNVSIDGASSETHDAIRGKGSFLKSISGIKNLIAQKCPVRITATMTRLNYREAEKIVLLAKELRAQRVQFVELMYIGNAASNAKDIALMAGERFELLSGVRDLKIKYGDFIFGSISKGIEIAGNLKLHPKPTLPLKTGYCVAGTIRCAIRPDGGVAPCERLWFLKAGDLKKESLRDIWQSSSIIQMFREPFIIREEDMPGCSKCRYLRPCYLVRRCKPYFFFRNKFEHRSLNCWNAGGAC